MTAHPGIARDREATRPRTRARRTQELLYRIGIGIKGFDGVGELLIGMLLWISPAMIVAVLSPAASTDGDDGALRLLIAHWAGQAIETVSVHPPVSFILFLLAHGVIKLALVFCLLKEYHWVYPYALSVLGLFTIYQLYLVVAQFSATTVIFAALDIVIIALVWREWQMLSGSPARSPRGATRAVNKMGES
jgi:uncharacterized membrane protein